MRNDLRRRTIIISKVKDKHWRKTHKFGIQVPKYVNESIAIDKNIGNKLWYTDIQKEMKNFRVAFEAWEEGSLEDSRSGQKLVGCQGICCHMIVDINMDKQFTRKACYVAGSHTTDPPSSITYSRVVSRDSTRIAFTLVALNDLEIRAANIGNTYFIAKCR